MLDPDVVELRVHGDWLLGAEKKDQKIVENRLFLITELPPSHFQGFSVIIERVNRFNLMGRGYVLQEFFEPCVGCEVSVMPGWELVSPSMQEDFLNRFVKIIQLERHDGTSHDR